MKIAVLLFALAASNRIEAPAPVPAAPTASDAAQTEALAAARELVAQVMPRVEEIRGLKFKRSVDVRIADAAMVRAHFEKRLAASATEDELRAQEAAYMQLGLLPPGETLAAGLIGALEGQARGFYDPESGAFYLVEGTPEPGTAVVIAHELAHALDDQHYDLERLIANARDDDASLALASVLEGSGTLVMAVYMAEEIAAGRLPPDLRQQLQNREGPAAARLQAAAPFYQRSLTAPYLLGLTFLLRGDPGRLRGGLAAADINQALEDPPLSTEQVLHPAKYWNAAARDVPRELSLPDLSAQLGRGFSLAGGGRMGELLLGVLVGAPTPDAAQGLDPALWHAPAAAGLQGDLWQHYSDGRRGVTVLAMQWDSPGEALEFLAALQPVARRRAYRHDATVLLIGGDLEERFDTLAPAAMSALEVTAKPLMARP